MNKRIRVLFLCILFSVLGMIIMIVVVVVVMIIIIMMLIGIIFTNTTKHNAEYMTNLIHLPIYLSTYLSLYPFIYLYTCPSAYLFKPPFLPTHGTTSGKENNTTVNINHENTDLTMKTLAKTLTTACQY